MDRNIGFDEQTFDFLAKYEDWHWWFQSRNKLIIKLIRKFSKAPQDVLEIGCGNGLVTSAIHTAFPEARIVGTEFLETGLANARKRLPDVSFEQLDARDLDRPGAFDAVCAFDVIEHIDADLDVMKRVRGALKDAQSRFYITVPQHMSLWSKADEYARHERRYTFTEMQEKLCKAGFEVEYRTSYVFLMSPLMFMSRRKNSGAEAYDPEEEFNISKPLNTVLTKVMDFEHLLRGVGMPMPFGGSLVVVAKPV